MPKRTRSLGLVALVLCLSLAALLARPPAQGDLLRKPSPADVVQNAWRNAQKAGAYQFQSEITQITHPGPALANVGRISRQETLHLQGETNLPRESLFLRLWDEKDGRGPQDAIEMRAEGEQAYGRCATCEWEPVEDFRGLFVPSADLMGHLAGAKNIVELEAETHGGLSFTRYAFDLDGPAFAEYLRAQMESHLRARGELPPGLSLDTAGVYAKMSGQGQIWIGEDELPVRLTVQFALPAGPRGDWVEARIQTDFSRYDVQLAQAPGFFEGPGAWSTRMLGQCGP